MSCICFNARSVNNKLPVLHSLLQGALFDLCYNLIFITETWLDSTCNDSMLVNNNAYSVIRHDRVSSLGGGVCVIYDNSLCCTQVVLPPKYIHLEVLCVDVTLKCDVQRFILCYNPPSYTAESMADLCACLAILCDVDYVCTVVGDFNLPMVNWLDLSVQPAKCADFINFVIDYGLSQLVREPTRGLNILDLILCNDSCAVLDLQYLNPFSTSDHLCLSWRSWFANAHSGADADASRNCDSEQFDFRAAVFGNLNAFLSAVDWVHVFASYHPMDVEALWHAFTSILFDAFNMYVPVKKSTGIKNIKCVYPRYIRNALNKKKALWRLRFSANGAAQYKLHAKKCDKLIRHFHSTLERRVIKSNCASTFFKYVGKKLNSVHQIAPLRASDGNFLFNDADKADALNKYFASVFTPASDATIPIPDLQSSCPVSPPVDFSISAVLTALRKAKHTLSSGPDRIPSLVWTKLASSIVFPVSIIFNSSYASSILPLDWKHAIVVPVHKKGDASCVTNYRPISLTSTLGKIMESMLKDNMLTHLHDCKLIDVNQHGFLPSHSTATQLLECSFDWCHAANNKIPTDVLYLDFSKAFDVISHSKLIQKLQSYNFCPASVKWLSAFLTNRTQSVKFNQSISSSVRVTSGAPQGSICGPILLLLFINDLSSSCAPCSVKLYADDVKLYFPIKDPADRVILQNCLDRVFEWALRWELKFSFNKCQYMQIGYSDPTIFYSLGNHKIMPTNTVCDLGVNFHSNLKPSQHCAVIAARANTRAKLILKCFLSHNRANYIRAFKCYVRPILEYCSVVWNPWLLQDINLLERVQRNFTRKVCILCRLPILSYEDRLLLFGLERLELRRLHADIVQLFKIIHQYSMCSLNDNLIFNVSNVHATRGNRFKLAVSRTNINCFKYHFINRVVPVWNILPDICFNTNSIKPTGHKALKIGF